MFISPRRVQYHLAQGLDQARHHLAHPARPGPACDPDTVLQHYLSWPPAVPAGARPDHHCPLALSTGGCEGGPARLIVAGKRPLSGEQLADQRWMSLTPLAAGAERERSSSMSEPGIRGRVLAARRVRRDRR